MGYLRFIRVATCCIVIQVALLASVSAFPQAGDDRQQSPEKVVKVHDVVVKEAEEQPGTEAHTENTYHAAKMISEQAKTDKGRRDEESTSTEDKNAHGTETVEYSTGEAGRRTEKKKKEEVRSNGHDEKKKVLETEGDAVSQRTEHTNGSNDQVSSSVKSHHELDGVSVKKEEKKLSEDIKESKDLSETCIDWKDKDHLEGFEWKLKTGSNQRNSDTSSANTNTYTDHEGTATIQKVDHIKSSKDESQKDHTSRYLNVGSGTYHSITNRESEDRDASTDVKETETHINHKTTVHDLNVDDIGTQEHNHKRRERNTVTTESKTTPESGTLVKSSTERHNVEEETVKHVDQFNAKLKLTTPKARNLSADFKTEIIDKDRRNVKDTSETETVSTARDGSKKTERVTEVTTEAYDMHKLEPTVTKKKKVEIVLNPTDGDGPKPTKGTPKQQQETEKSKEKPVAK